jgi:hypothetical protein
MNKIGERKLRNFNIDIENITFRKKNSKRIRSIIPISESIQLPVFAQLPALSESPPPQSETSAESQSLF